MSRCPARWASVHGSICGAQRVRQVCRRVYRGNGCTAHSFGFFLPPLHAFTCGFFTVDGSTWPLFVGAGKTHGLSLPVFRISSTAATRWETGIWRLALSVLPY